MLLKKPEDKNGHWEKALDLTHCIAKTVSSMGSQGVPGLNIEAHSKIVGLIARELGSRLPRRLQDSMLPLGFELVAASHDVGKINPHFQAKIYSSIYPDISHIEELSSAKPEMEKQIGYHSAVSQAALKGSSSRFVPEIVGRHHGASPQSTPLKNDESIGGEVWQRVREELIEKLKIFFNRDWPVINSDLQADFLAGLTSVADWIGSGPIFDSLSSIDEGDLAVLVQEALDRAGFVRPEIIKDLSFSDIFPGFTPFPFQSHFISMVDGPGVYVMEALMGKGKTEAALYASYKLIQQGSASGIYFALPTRLTSEKMYERMNRFLQKILAPQDKHTNLLLHGQSWLYETDLGADGQPGYSWFNSAKRGLLAPFAVGTIDQALMAVMNVKHGFVRSFGLAGKVVILDEVHSYDAYTGAIMAKLVASLRSLGSTIILLSATLSGSRKSSLLSFCGREKGFTENSNYPLATKFQMDCEVVFSERIQTEERTIRLFTSSDEREATEKALEKASWGEQVLWIENTVTEAQSSFRYLSARAREVGVEVGLLHSRFPQILRAEIEQKWVNLFGKNNTRERASRGRILVGTQVLEQSLDIDADFLVSRLAPTDMILQRIGRLWRHESNNAVRPAAAGPEVILLTPGLDKLEDNLEYVFGPSGKVYSPYVLARTMELMYSLQKVCIPVDIRELIEKTYQERQDPPNFQIAFRKLQDEKQRLERFARLSTASMGQTLSESASTRYSDIVSCDVLLLTREPDLNSAVISFWDGVKVCLKGSAALNEKKEVIRQIQKRIVSVPSYLAPAAISKNELSWLKPYIYVSDQEEERVRVGILEKSGSIRGLDGRMVNSHYDLYFDSVMGFSAIKKEA
jgi:CRISPR-associated endonuclease/helicase Cas3